MAALTVFSFLSLSLAAVLCTPLPDQQASCPPSWTSFNGRCYKYVSTLMNWADAEYHCVNVEGANLVSVHSLEEFNFLQKFILNHQDFDLIFTWIGLTDRHKDGRWVWSDGTKVDFTQWNDKEPNGHVMENCGETNKDKDLKWNDAPCTSARPFVCASRIL